MLIVYIDSLVSLMDELRSLENEVHSWPSGVANERAGEVGDLLAKALSNCEELSFASALKQIKRIISRFESGIGISPTEIATMISEFRTRISEDIQDKAFFCVTDPAVIIRFFKSSSDEGYVGSLDYKRPDEVFHSIILQRFPETLDDLSEACKCFIKGCYTGCVFHLMRVVEFSVLKVATLGGIHEPKASWGAVLSKLDKYAYRTEYKDLPPDVQPHIELIKKLLPKMHAIQHAWRNKISHVEDKLIPVGDIAETVALEIMNATESYMRTLAEEFPK